MESYKSGEINRKRNQARSHVVYGEVRSNEETDQMRSEGQVSGGGGERSRTSPPYRPGNV